MQFLLYNLNQFNEILYSLKTPDHWYMHWLTGEGHKKEKQNTCTTKAKRGKINTKCKNTTCKCCEKTSQEEQTLFRIFLINLESDFRVSILPAFIILLNLNVLWYL